MTECYILMSSYFDGCECWENIVDVYSDRGRADTARDALEKANDDPEHDSWFIRTQVMK